MELVSLRETGISLGQVRTCIQVLSGSLAVGAKVWGFACGPTDPLYSFPHPGTTFEMQT